MTDNLPVPTVADEESGEVVAITEEMRLQALAVHDQVRHHGHQVGVHLFEFGRHLKRMRDERLYLALGMRSFSAYCEAIKLPRSLASERISATEVTQELASPENVRPVEQLSYTSAVLLARAHPDDRAKVVAEHDISKMSKRETAAALEQAKQLRLRAEEAERKNRELETQLAQYKEIAATAERRCAKFQDRASKAEEELAARPTIEVPKEVPVVKLDEKAREDNARLREENANLRAAQGRIGDLKAEQERLLAGNRTLQQENAALQADNLRLANLQEEALRVNMALSELADVVTRHRGLFETAKAREYGDWLDLQGIYDTETLLQAILRDFHRIAKDCVRR